MFTWLQKEERWEQAALDLTGLNRRNKCFTSIQVVLFGGQRRKYIWEGLAQFQEKSKQEPQREDDQEKLKPGRSGRCVN